MVVHGKREDASFRHARRCRKCNHNSSVFTLLANDVPTSMIHNFYLTVIICMLHSIIRNCSNVSCFTTRYSASRRIHSTAASDLLFTESNFGTLKNRRISRSPPTFHTLSSSTDDYYQKVDDKFHKLETSKGRPKGRVGPTISSRSYWESMDDFDNDSDSHEDLQQETSSHPNEVRIDNDVLEWEKCSTPAGTAWVLLPPLSVTKPTCVVHFVGGTFMGSAPHIWYCTLLHDLVRHTSCAIIATSIPITVTRSPLNHVRLSTQLLEQFRIAYRDVIVDEYGSDILQSVSICGIGHSLGARLLAVLATSTLGEIQASKKGQLSLSYKSMVLISFTNYGAAAGIPGIANLYRKSRMVERQNQQPKANPKFSRRGGNWWDINDENEHNFDNGDSLSEILHEVSEVVQAGATSLQNALTPPSKSLEFYPTPELLWTAIKHNGRYTIPQTLIIQFDDDDIDQSALLATLIVNCSDVKFARIRGTHLTPISIHNNGNGVRPTRSENESLLQQINSRAGRVLVKSLQGRELSKRNEESLLELKQSIARYIIEIVTKE
jgi:Protein of unknown function (DUF1350)